MPRLRQVPRSEASPSVAMLYDLLFGEGRLLSDIIEAVVGAGGQVLFVGDDHQLAPVGSDHLPALDAETLSRRGLTVAGASLTQVHRQEEGSDILDLAHGCRASVDNGEPLPPLPTHTHSAVQHLANKSDAPHWLLEASWRGEAMVIAARHVDAGTWITRVRAHQGASPHQPERGDRLVLVRGDFSIGLLNGDEVTVVEHLGQETVHHVKHRDRSVTLHTLLLETVTPMGTTTRFVGRVIDDLLLRAEIVGRHRLRQHTREQRATLRPQRRRRLAAPPARRPRRRAGPLRVRPSRPSPRRARAHRSSRRSRAPHPARRCRGGRCSRARERAHGGRARGVRGRVSSSHPRATDPRPRFRR